MDNSQQAYLIFLVASLALCMVILIRMFIQVRSLKKLNARLQAELDKVRTPRMDPSPTRLIS